MIKAIELAAPQIVNGCQSAHVLVANAAALADCHVPVKIIITQDEGLKDSIVLASNTQAAVDDYDMLARNQGLRDLETAFDRSETLPHHRVWLQRRRNEPVDWPDHWEGKDWTRVVRPRHLLDAYAASIAGIPHTAHDKPGNILAMAKNETVFHVDHEPTLYRALGWLVVNGRKWAHRNRRKWQDQYTHSGPGAYPARHHFVHALWRLADVTPDAIGAGDLRKSGAADERFQLLINVLQQHGEKMSDAAGSMIDEAAKTKGGLGRDLAVRKYFTDDIRSAVDAGRASVRARIGV